MNKLKMTDLAGFAAELKQARSKYKGYLLFCTGSSCSNRGNNDLLAEMKRLVGEAGLENDYFPMATGCNGFCSAGPLMVVQPEGIFYQKLKLADLPLIVEQHLKGGKPVEKLMFKDPVTKEINPKIDEIGFFAGQKPIALRNRGKLNPENIEDYISMGGYESLREVLAQGDPEAVINEVIASGLRGRGGGGFNTGRKWEAGRKAANEKNEEIYVVCNANEFIRMGDSIISTDPHSVLEGMLIGAWAVGAKDGFIYIRQENELTMKRLHTALRQARELGLLGENILGTDFSFDISIHRAPEAFIAGESSAIMQSMSGRVAEPQAKYVHNTESGFRGKPTVLNNVETWANIPVVIAKGSEWFAENNTKIISLVGDINNTGQAEVPLRMPLRQIVEQIGGGVPAGRAVKAVQTGGSTGGIIPAENLDIPYTYCTLAEAGSIIGSGSVMVIDDHKCMVETARYFIEFLSGESCGKCTPCREGLFQMNKILTRICDGEGREGDLETLEELAITVKETSLCKLGVTAPNPVLTALKHFREEFEEHIRDKKCRAGVCKALVTYSINADKCVGCTLCARNCPVDAIAGEVKKLHVIDTEKCIKCGICYETCKFDAVEVK